MHKHYFQPEAETMPVNEIKKLPRKLILDLPAAMLLQQRGTDVGLRGTEDAGIPCYERYHDLENAGFIPPGHSSLQFQYAKYQRVTTDDNAEILSLFEDAETAWPSAYRYDNGECEFYVLCVDGYTMRPNCSVFLSYGRQEQLLDFIGAIPHVKREPGVYMMWKTDSAETALLVQNLSEDVLFDFDVHLDRAYQSVSIYGGEGTLWRTKLHITSDVAPHGALLITLK